MGYLFEHLWLSMLIAAILGLIVGWWMWHRREAEGEVEYRETAAAPVIPPAPAEPKPAAPVAAAAAAAPAAKASPFMAAPDGEPDDLRRIKGVGPKLNNLLNSLGVYHFRQIAAWDAEQVAEVDTHLGNFKGRITRDRWIDQADYLAADDVAGFETEFGNIGKQT